MQSPPVINPVTYAMLKENLAEILPELKEAFLEDGFILLDQIKENLSNGDNNIMSNAAHTLKSSAKNIGADQLANYCVQIEAEAPNKPELIPALYQQALSEMLAVQDSLSKLD